MSLPKTIYHKLRYEIKKLIRRSRIEVHLPTVFLGNKIYGGWTVYPKNLNENSVVYSLGVGEDISWDLAMVEQYNVNLYTFDPTPRSITFMENQSLPEKLNFLPYGVADYDGTIQFYPPENPEHVSYTIIERSAEKATTIDVPVKRLQTICEELGHTHIDLMKINIEGAEYAVLGDMLKSGIKVSQILVEFHHRWENISENQTREMINALKKHGYRIFDVSPALKEYAFISVDLLNESTH